MSLHLHGVGHFHPENELTNRFLEELDIGTTESWIVERVGIRSRRTTLPLDYIRTTRNRDPRAAAEAALYDTAELGRRAAERALTSAGIRRSDVGMVLAGSCATDVTTPAEACEIARRLGVAAPSFDVASACTSFLAQLTLLSKMRPEALPPFVLVVTPEALTRSVDYADRSTAVLFGDGAAAAVVSARVPGRARILHADLASDPAAADKVRIPRVGHFAQEGRAVQMFAIRKSLEALGRLEGLRGDDDRPLHWIGHQANLRVLQTVSERAGLDPARHHSNVTLYGNTGAASAPSVLSQVFEKFGPEDDVALVGVGAGLTWGGALLRFEAAA
ncbi:MAG TPA: ketoacyl-ACP synthase III [Myxococcota bacterium]|nr:ketoacyl-ACP synthase III [Myxococcota bacterium]